MISIILNLLVAAAALPIGSAAAGNGSQSDEPAPFHLITLESPGAERASLPSLARGADGVVRLSWVERSQDRQARLMLAAFVDGRFQDPVQVAAGKDWFVNWADFPATSALADGTLVAAWMKRNGKGTYAYGIAISLSKDAGQTWSEAIWLHEDLSPSEHGFVSLAPLDKDSFLAVWLDGRHTGAALGTSKEAGGPQEVWSRTIHRDGSLGLEMRVDERACDCCQTSLVRDSDGNLVAAWRDRSESEVRDIYFARFQGEGWGRAKAVHTDGWELPGCPVNGPRLAVGPNKELACLWYTGGENLGTYVAFQGSGAARLGSAGAKGDAFGTPLRIDSGASAGRVEALFLHNGDLLVTWMEHSEDGVQWQARLVAGSGRSSRAVTIADTSSDRRTGFLRAAPLDDGALLAWTDPDGDGLRIARLKLSD